MFFSPGVAEIFAGIDFAFLSKNTNVLQLAKYLITEVVNDIILSIKVTIKGEEIN